MDGDSQGDPAHDIYHAGLRNQHAVETSAIELCRRQVERLEHYPEMTARLRQHVTESEAQVRRLDRILERHGSSPSAVKAGLASLTGNLAAALHAPAPDEILKNTLDNYAFEHFEIAAYTSLIAMAQAVGDTESVAPLRQSLAEEQAMAEFIGAQTVPTTERYLALARGGTKAGV